MIAQVPMPNDVAKTLHASPNDLSLPACMCDAAKTPVQKRVLKLASIAQNFIRALQCRQGVPSSSRMNMFVDEVSSGALGGQGPHMNVGRGCAAACTMQTDMVSLQPHYLSGTGHPPAP